MNQGLAQVEDNKTPPPPKEETNVIQLLPKKVDVKEKEIEQLRDVFMRRQKCLFENNFGGGCKCNYCTFFNMMGQRVFEMIKMDLHYQSKKGSMVFTSQDMLDILQLACERVLQYEKMQEKPPIPPKK